MARPGPERPQMIRSSGCQGRPQRAPYPWVGLAHRLDEAAAGRAVAWVSAEGVGVAPTIPMPAITVFSSHLITRIPQVGSA